MPIAVVRDWLEPTRLRWPDAADGPWVVTLSWREGRNDHDRVVECCGLSLDPVEDGDTEPISATLIRRLPVAKLIAAGRRINFEEAGGSLLEALDDGQDIDVSFGLQEALREESAPWAERRAGRPAHLSDDHYRQVALAYTEAHAAGSSPLLAVQERWTVSRPTASRWVATTREKGLLPLTERGRAKSNPQLLGTSGDER